jgi:hypothetical protein
VDSYDVGDKPKLIGRFVSEADGTPLTPDAAEFRMRHPNGNLDVFPYPGESVTELEAGALIVRPELTEPGIYWYGFLSEDAVHVAEEAPFNVRQPRAHGAAVPE